MNAFAVALLQRARKNKTPQFSCIPTNLFTSSSSSCCSRSSQSVPHNVQGESVTGSEFADGCKCIVMLRLGFIVSFLPAMCERGQHRDQRYPSQLVPAFHAPSFRRYPSSFHDPVAFRTRYQHCPSSEASKMGFCGGKLETGRRKSRRLPCST
jgi:hypothetical protein